jgi:L-fuculose-phosphate aldolase
MDVDNSFRNPTLQLAYYRHTHSSTLGIAISVIGKFQHIIEEAKIVVGNPVLISNKPSRPADLANLVSEAFRHGGEYLRAVIIKNHGVVAVGSDMLL